VTNLANRFVTNLANRQMTNRQTDRPKNMTPSFDRGNKHYKTVIKMDITA